MSNPLAAFRRYQHTLLVIFGIMLMIVFLIGGVTGDRQRDSETAAQRKVAVSWQEGATERKLVAGELQRIRQLHFLAVRFVRNVLSRAIEQGAQVRGFPLDASEDDESIVRNWLLSERAEREGVEISNDAIVQWLNAETQDTVTSDEYNAILTQVVGRRSDSNTLFEALRVELRSQQMLNMLISGIYPSLAPPSLSVAWDLNNRLQRRLDFEFMPVAVQDGIDQVPDPPAAEVERLYQQYKNRLPNPESPEPGFKVPLRRAFAFVSVDTTQAMEEELKNISDADVQTYYDEHREEFKVEDDIQSLLDSIGSGKAPDPGPSSSENSAPDSTDTDSTDTDSTDTNSTDTNSTDTNSTDTGSTDIESSEPETTAPGAPSESDTNGACGDEESADDDAEASAADDVPSTDAASTDAPVDEITPPLDETPATPDLLATPDVAPPEKSALESTPAAEASSSAGTDPTAGGTDRAPIYQPLEKVADSIRNRLASPRVAERVNAAFERVTTAIEEYNDIYLDWQVNRDIDKETPQPEPPDVAQMARESGLQFDTIPLQSAASIFASHPLGKAYQFSGQGERSRVEPFLQKAFGPGIQLYRPVKFGSPMLQNEMVFWATSEDPEHIPPLSDCREEVLRAWKMKRALEWAQKKADSLADEARAAQKSLREQFVGQNYRVFEPDSEQGVSWMTTSTLPVGEGGGTFPSPIPDMPHRSVQTMEQIFRLQPGEYGTAIDAPEQTVYVVHIKAEKSTPVDVRNAFLNPASLMFVGEMSAKERQRVLLQQIQEWQEQIHLTWHETPSRS